MKLRNLKASFILKDKVCGDRNGKNYIFKCDGFTFTIYRHSPYLVNVTGIKSFERLKLAREIIEEKLQKTVCTTMYVQTPICEDWSGNFPPNPRQYS